MTESVAGLIAESVATSNRYGGSGDPDPIAQEFRYREKLRQTLTASKTSKEKIDEILAPFAQWIPFDLRSSILQATLNAELKKGVVPKETNAFQSRLQTALEISPPLEGLDRATQILHEAGLSSPELTKSLDRYKRFLTEDRL